MPSPPAILRRLRCSKPDWNALCLQLAAACADACQRLATPLDADDIHELRLTAKRLRAGWQLLRSWHDPQLCCSRNRQVAAMAASLAGQRDRDVLGQTLARLQPHCSTAAQIQALATAQCALLPAAAPGTAPDLPALQQVLEQEQALWQAMGRLAPPPDWWHQGIRRLQRRAASLRRQAVRDGHAEDFHAWRKWAKYELYACQLAQPPVSALDARLQRLTALGTLLGKLHDLDELQRQLQARPGADGWPALLLPLVQQQIALRRQQALEGEALW